MAEEFKASSWFVVTVGGVHHWAAACRIDPPQWRDEMAARLQDQKVLIDGEEFTIRSVGGFAINAPIDQVDLLVYEREGPRNYRGQGERTNG